MKVGSGGGSGRVGRGGSVKSRGSKPAAESSSKVKLETLGAIHGAEESDSVQVGSHSETLHMIREIVRDTPDIRVDEVQRVVDQIRRGKYKINFEKVADGFIREMITNEISKRMTRKSDA